MLTGTRWGENTFGYFALGLLENHALRCPLECRQPLEGVPAVCSSHLAGSDLSEALRVCIAGAHQLLMCVDNAGVQNSRACIRIRRMLGAPVPSRTISQSKNPRVSKLRLTLGMGEVLKAWLGSSSRRFHSHSSLHVTTLRHQVHDVAALVVDAVHPSFHGGRHQAGVLKMACARLVMYRALIILCANRSNHMFYLFGGGGGSGCHSSLHYFFRTLALQQSNSDVA